MLAARVSVPQESRECPTRVFYKLDSTRLCHKRVPQERPTRVSHHKSVLQGCPASMSHKNVPQECPTRVSHKSVPQECPTRVSHNNVPQECLLQECPAKMPCKERLLAYKGVLQECPAGVSHKSVSYKSVVQECPTRMSMVGPLFSSACVHSGSWAQFLCVCVLVVSQSAPMNVWAVAPLHFVIVFVAVAEERGGNGGHTICKSLAIETKLCTSAAESQLRGRLCLRRK